jgi:hypothetical protein
MKVKGTTLTSYISRWGTLSLFSSLAWRSWTNPFYMGCKFFVGRGGKKVSKVSNKGAIYMASPSFDFCVFE